MRAASHFDEIESPKEEDIYYQALSELYHLDLDSSIDHFNGLRSGSGNYLQEIYGFLG